MSRQNNTPPITRRAALYIRVSTEEQAKKGYSLEAQREDLEEFANKNGYVVVDHYIDEGKSARKKYTRRTEFMRMLEDIRAGKIDVILFIKLDRWFRNIADYYKIQEILDEHNVAWKTTQEHYDTETTNGRLYINIRLSVAQDESDRDSDRIKFVFESKVSRGEVITGSLPLGLKIQNKHIVSDPQTADAARAVFSHFRQHHSICGAVRMLEEVYGIITYDHTVRDMLRNPLYAGRYRDNPDYCTPLVEPEVFDEIQRTMAQRSIRTNQSGRVYIFSGLLTCAVCGQHMTGNHNQNRGRDYSLYRCRNAVVYHRCTHRKSINEANLEQWLLAHILEEAKHWQITWTAQSVTLSKPKTNRAALFRKLEKLKDLYVNELIDMEQYRTDYEKYQALLIAQPESPAPASNLEDLVQGLNSGSISAYQMLQPANRRAFWRGIIQSISLDEHNAAQVLFR